MYEQYAMIIIMYHRPTVHAAEGAAAVLVHLCGVRGEAAAVAHLPTEYVGVVEIMK